MKQKTQKKKLGYSTFWCPECNYWTRHTGEEFETCTGIEWLGKKIGSEHYAGD